MKNNRLFKVLLGGMIASFILVFAFTFTGVCFAAEEVAAETTEATTKIQSALDWLKQISAEDLKGWFIGFITFLGANATIFLGVGIALIKAKTSKIQQSQFYEDLKAKMVAEHQTKMENLFNDFNAKLDDVQASLKDTIANLDEKKKEEAKNNIAVLKNELDNIKVDLEK